MPIEKGVTVTASNVDTLFGTSSTWGTYRGTITASPALQGIGLGPEAPEFRQLDGIAESFSAAHTAIRRADFPSTQQTNRARHENLIGHTTRVAESLGRIEGYTAAESAAVTGEINSRFEETDVEDGRELRRTWSKMIRGDELPLDVENALQKLSVGQLAALRKLEPRPTRDPRTGGIVVRPVVDPEALARVMRSRCPDLDRKLTRAELRQDHLRAAHHVLASSMRSAARLPKSYYSDAEQGVPDKVLVVGLFGARDRSAAIVAPERWKR
jgi:hypothetical protein